MLSFQNHYPAFCQFSLLQDHHYTYRKRHVNPDLIWKKYPPKVQENLNKLRLRYTPQDPALILNSRMKKFERKLKFFQRLNHHYNIFLDRPIVQLTRKKLRKKLRFPPHTKTIYNRSLTKFNASLSHSNERIVQKPANNNRKSRSRRRKNITLLLQIPQEQMVENLFEGNTQTVRIYNRPTTNDNFDNQTLLPKSLMGDHYHRHNRQSPEVDEDQNNENDHWHNVELQQEQEYYNPESAITSSLEPCFPSGNSQKNDGPYFPPICSFQLINNSVEDGLSNSRYSSHHLKDAKSVKLMQKQKNKRVLQLQIIQDKMNMDSKRLNLENHTELDRDWTVISQELHDNKGKLVTIRRTIQYNHDKDIIIHESLASSILHQNLEESLLEIHEFLSNLSKKDEHGENDHVENYTTLNNGNQQELNIKLKRKTSVTSLQQQETNQNNRKNQLLLPHPSPSANNDAIIVQQPGQKDVLEHESHQQSDDKFWFARNYNNNNNNDSIGGNAKTKPKKRLRKLFQCKYLKRFKLLTRHPRSKKPSIKNSNKLACSNINSHCCHPSITKQQSLLTSVDKPQPTLIII